jgi:hypothetical protein
MTITPEMYAVVAMAGLGAVAVALSLYWFLLLKMRMARSERRLEAKLDPVMAQAAAAAEAIEGLRRSLGDVSAGLAEMREWSGTLVAPPPARSGLNLTVRSQVLRRRRMGEDTAEIARSLGLPQTEVDLLIKVNTLLLSTLPPA